MDNEFKLREKIIELSESKDWYNAKKEWEFENIYVSDEFEECLCGHYPIINICRIRNRVNNNVTEVGNVCINKFLNIDEGEKILPSINRVKKDITKSISKDSLEYLYKKECISIKEYDFYSDIIKKRILSPARSKWKSDINKKFLRLTSYEANHIQERIDKILNWAKDKPNFDTSMLKSFKSYYIRKGYLSDKQENALNNIISKCKIE